MGTKENIRLHYPLSIAKLYMDVHLESDERLQFRKLVDLFEGTVRHLALIGLAGYLRYQLEDSYIESMRPGLEKPSLGHWTNLLKALAPIVEPHSIRLLGLTPKLVHKEDAIAKFVDIGMHILGDKEKAKLDINRFLSIVVQCRNKKIGHGDILKSEAKKVVGPFEAALFQWFEELPILQQQKVVYVTSVEWYASQFHYRCINLNSGDSLTDLIVNDSQGIESKQVYLYSPDDGSFLSLHPFFYYCDDDRLLYVYHELSNKKKLLLRCPYEIPGGAAPYPLDSVDKAIVIGGSQIKKAPSVDISVRGESQNSMTVSPPIEIKPETPSKIVINEQTPKSIETITEISKIDNEALQKKITKNKRLVSKLDIVVEESKSITTFDTLIQELENRIRLVCHSQARYPILWTVGAPCTGKTILLRSLCHRVGWKYVDFTLDMGYLDRLIGQEETYRIEDFQEVLHSIDRASPEKIIVIDEIEPLLTLWNWDEQEIFFRKISKTMRLQCGFVLVTHQRKAQELESLLPNRNQVFEIPEGVGL